MDLLVFTNGALRSISGVNESTTCAQVVYALAHATYQKGRFVLVATFSDSEHEHRLTPDERPYGLLESCTQKGVEVSFELRKIDLQVPQQQVYNSALYGEQQGNDHAEIEEQQLTLNHHSKQHQDSKKSSTSSCSSSRVQMELEITKIKALAEGRGEVEMKTPISFAAAVPFPSTSSSSCTSLPDPQPYKPPTMSHNTSVPILARREQAKRPPPPSYNRIIEERCNSLTRNNQLNNNNNKYDSVQRPQPVNSAFNPYHNTTKDLYERKMSIEELRNYVEAQIQIIAAQRAELKEFEVALSNDSERELLQLKKQHNNLQSVLNSLRNANWPERVKCEQSEAESLNTAIDAMKTAIENKKRELYQVLELQRKLELQYVFEGSQELGAEDIELRDPNQIAYPQKFEAIS